MCVSPSPMLIWALQLVVSVLQNTRGSTLGREGAHYSENKSVRSKFHEFSRKFKRSGVYFNDLWRVLQSSSKILKHLCAFPFPYVDLGITVVSVLQNTRFNDLWRVLLVRNTSLIPWNSSRHSISFCIRFILRYFPSICHERILLIGRLYCACARVV